MKHLCKWKSEKIGKKFDEYCDCVLPAKFICKKCGRAAKSSELLCSPKKIKVK